MRSPQNDVNIETLMDIGGSKEADDQLQRFVDNKCTDMAGFKKIFKKSSNFLQTEEDTKTKTASATLTTGPTPPMQKK